MARALAVGMLAAASIGATSIGAADAAWDPPSCPGGAERLTATARAAEPVNPGDLADEAWYTLDPRLDPSGGLAGHRLRIGTRGGDRARFLELPPESAAAGPFGRIVLVATDDGRRSTIRAVDRRAGCAWSIASTGDVVRRVTMDPAGGAVYEFRLDRRSRADLGVWRRPLDGSAPRRVLDPPPHDRAVGITFSTTLGWSAEGDTLVVQQCGALRCRTRLLEPAGGRVSIVDDADHGELIGVADGAVVAYAACAGLPCPVVATGRVDGRHVVLHEQAGLARLVATTDGPRLAVQAGSDGGPVEVRRVDGGLAGVVEVAGAGHLMPGPDRALAGTRLPPGWLVLAPDGRSPADAILARLVDGATVELREVTR